MGDDAKAVDYTRLIVDTVHRYFKNGGHSEDLEPMRPFIERMRKWMGDALLRGADKYLQYLPKDVRAAALRSS